LAYPSETPEQAVIDDSSLRIGEANETVDRTADAVLWLVTGSQVRRLSETGHGKVPKGLANQTVGTHPIVAVRIGNAMSVAGHAWPNEIGAD